MTTFDDRDFGKLEADDLFNLTRPYEVELFGSKYAIRLCVRGSDSDGTIPDYQRGAFLQLEREKARFCRETEDELMKYYRSIVEEVRTWLGESADEMMPVISDKYGLGKIFEPTEVLINCLREDEEIDFLFECSWDLDLGLAVKFVKGRFIEFGDQGDII